MKKENRLFYIFLVLSAVVIVIGAILLLPKYEPDKNKETAKNEPTATPVIIPQVGSQPDKSWEKVPEKERSSWLKDRLMELNNPRLKTVAQAKLNALDEKAIPELIKLSNDPKYGPTAVNLIQKISKKPEAQPAIQNAMTGEDRQAKVAMFKAGAEKPTEEYKQNFIRTLETSTDEKLIDQLLLIAQNNTMKDPRIADVLLQMLPTYKDPSNYLMIALGGQGDERAVEPLSLKLQAYRKNMDDNEAIVMRSNIIRTLGRIGGEKALQTITAIPPEENDLIVMDSITAFTEAVNSNPKLAKNLGPDVKENLIKLLESNKPVVFGAVNDALCVLTGQTIQLPANPSENDMKDLAAKWRATANK